MEQILDYADASKLLGVPKGTLYSWVHDKKITFLRYGPRLVRFQFSDLMRFKEQNLKVAPELIDGK